MQKRKTEPNKAMEPTVNVTIPGSAGLAPFNSSAHLWRGAKMIKGFALSVGVMLLHAALWLASLAVWMQNSFRRLDHPEVEAGFIELFCKCTAYVLGLPICTTMLLMRPAHGYPNFLEWIALPLNSAIWGLSVTSLCFYYFSSRRKGSAAAPTKRSYNGEIGIGP